MYDPRLLNTMDNICNFQRNMMFSTMPQLYADVWKTSIILQNDPKRGWIGLINMSILIQEDAKLKRNHDDHTTI